MSLGTSSNIRITRHHRYTVYTHGKNNCFQSESCTRQCCLASGMSGSDYNHIIFFLYIRNLLLFHFSVLNSYKILNDSLSHLQSANYFLFTHTEFTEDFIYQIIFHRFTDNISKFLVSIHQINGIKIFRHIICNTLQY